jgi:hypothetical protein
MRLARHTLALLLVGCFQSHGPPRGALPARDGGPVFVFDAPAACGEVPSVDVTLTCPSHAVGPGPAGTVHVEANAPFCCPDSAARVHVSGTDIQINWDLCECCEECLCIGGHFSGDIDVGFPSGPVTAHGQSCTFGHLEECLEEPIDQVFAPSTVFVGEEIPVLARTSSARSCGCNPRGTYDGSLHLEACNCGCRDCDCIDPGYETTILTPPQELGIGSTPPPLSVPVRIADAACFEPAAVSRVDLIAPDRSYRNARRDVWLEVGVLEPRCCGEPALAIHSVVEGNRISLALCETTPDPCDCDPIAPHSFSEYHYVGTLSPGSYEVGAGAHIFSIVVP